MRARRNRSHGERVKVADDFAVALTKRILIVPNYVEMSLMRKSRRQWDSASNGAVQNRY